MKHILGTLCMVAYLLLATGASSADKAAIKKNVDDMVVAIDNGKVATSYGADTYTPYAFVMEPSGKLIVHPHLAGEFLQEKAAPVYKALQQATREGIWVTYFWKGATKETYVRKTKSDLTVGSGN